MRHSFSSILLALLALACNASNDSRNATIPVPDNSPTPPPEESPQTTAQRVQSILERMTLEEKIGQIIQADISSVTPQEASNYNLGSVLNGGNSAPGGNKTARPEDWVALADAFWTASTNTSDGGVGIPLLWGTDAVHGHNNLQTATLFPHNSGLGATHNPELIQQIGSITAREIRATGLDWTFAPTLAVARDDRWGRTYESYSENPDLVAQYAAAIITGLQGVPGDDTFLHGQNIMATAKHFIGDGGTLFGIDKGDTHGTLDDIIALHGAGYLPAFDADVQTVMASFSSINGEKMHGSYELLTTVLRDQMGFEGFVIGDWNGHAEIPGCTATNCPQALQAGIDMYMAPDSWKGLYYSLRTQVYNGDIDISRLDEAVTRILTVKVESGLLDAPRPSERPATDISLLGHPDHRAVARQAVRESLVLLKNEHGVLPIQPGSDILVTGSGANSMQQQTGGWTLNWQGTGNSNEEFQTGETIFAGLKTAAEAFGGSAFLSASGTFNETPDVVIVVFGEHPYAEYRGDRSDLVYEFSQGENLRLIQSFKDMNIPVVSVFLTGRPLWVNPHINRSDAFVVAWLPGSEGGGLADVLLSDASGNVRHDFKGRLAFSWPADGTGNPTNTSDAPNTLYPFGYGLTYTEQAVNGHILSEEPGVADASLSFDGSIFAHGEPTDAFSMFIGDSSNNNVPVTAMTMKSLGGNISISGLDYAAQEDARRLEWSGNGRAIFGLHSRRALDLTRLGDVDKINIVLTWQPRLTEQDDVIISMQCGDGCGGWVNLKRLIPMLPTGEWVTSEFPLSCFVDQGLDPTNLTTALAIESDDAIEIAVHAISLSVHEATLPKCPALNIAVKK